MSDNSPKVFRNAPHKCFACNYQKNYRNNQDDTHISLFSLPRNQRVTLIKWLKVLNVSAKFAIETKIKICSQHFSPRDFWTDFGKARRLKHDAVPRMSSKYQQTKYPKYNKSEDVDVIIETTNAQKKRLADDSIKRQRILYNTERLIRYKQFKTSINIQKDEKPEIQQDVEIEELAYDESTADDYEVADVIYDENPTEQNPSDFSNDYVEYDEIIEPINESTELTELPSQINTPTPSTEEFPVCSCSKKNFTIKLLERRVEYFRQKNNEKNDLIRNMEKQLELKNQKIFELTRIINNFQTSQNISDDGDQDASTALEITILK